MDFETLTTQEKITHANEMYQWYERKYKIEVPKEEKDSFLMEACYNPNGLALFRETYNTFLEASQDQGPLRKKVEQAEIEFEISNEQLDEIVKIEKENDICETTFGTIPVIDVEEKLQHLKNIVKETSVIEDSIRKHVRENKAEIVTLTSSITSDLDKTLLDVKNVETFKLEDFAQSDELVNALQIIKQSTQIARKLQMDKARLKRRKDMLRQFILKMRESRSERQIEQAVNCFGDPKRDPNLFKIQVNNIKHKLNVLKEQEKRKRDDQDHMTQKNDSNNNDFSDKILKLYSNQLENEIALIQSVCDELDFYHKLHSSILAILDRSVDKTRSPHVVNIYQSKLLSDLTELTEKINLLIQKEHRRRSDSFKVRGFVDDDDEIGHLLAKYYDLEASQSELIVPVVQIKQICAKVKADIDSKIEAKAKKQKDLTNQLNLLVKNIETNLSDLPKDLTNRLDKVINFEREEKKVGQNTTLKSRTNSTFASSQNHTRFETPFLEKFRLDFDNLVSDLDDLSQKWDKEISNDGLNLFLASQQLSIFLKTQKTD